MVQQELHLGGSVLFWSLGALSRRDVIEAGFTDAGFGLFVPEPRRPAACLRDALEQVYSDPRVLVRPCQDRDSFHLVREVRGARTAGNNYLPLFSATIDAETSVMDFQPRPGEDHVEAIIAAYNQNLGLIRAANLSATLVTIVDSLGGVRLRPSGAIYWLSEQRLSDWQQAARVVELAGKNACYTIHHRMDADAVRAVRDAVVAEVMAESQRILRSVEDGNQGQLALSHRQQEAQLIRQKIKEFELLLDTGLSELHQAVETAEEAACRAALLVSAGEAEHAA